MNTISVFISTIMVFKFIVKRKYLEEDFFRELSNKTPLIYDYGRKF